MKSYFLDEYIKNLKFFPKDITKKDITVFDLMLLEKAQEKRRRKSRKGKINV